MDAALDQEHNRLLAADDDLMTQVAALRRRVPALVVERWRAEAHAVAGTPDHRSTAVFPPTVQEALTTPITSLPGRWPMPVAGNHRRGAWLTGGPCRLFSGTSP